MNLLPGEVYISCFIVNSKCHSIHMCTFTLAKGFINLINVDHNTNKDNFSFSSELLSSADRLSQFKKKTL